PSCQIEARSEREAADRSGWRIGAEIVGQGIGLCQERGKALPEPPILCKFRSDIVADEAVEGVDATARMSGCSRLRSKRLPMSLGVLRAFHVWPRQLIGQGRAGVTRSRGVDRARARRSRRSRAKCRRRTADQTTTSRAARSPNESTRPGTMTS